MVMVFDETGRLEVAVGEQGRFGGTGGAGSEVKPSLVCDGDIDAGFLRAVLTDQRRIVEGKGRAVRCVSDEDIGLYGLIQCLLYAGDAIDELGAKNDYFCFGQGCAPLDGGRHEPEIQRNRPGAGFQYAEVDRQPLDAIGHQLHHPIAFVDAQSDQGLRQSVGLPVKGLPRQGKPSVLAGIAFNQRGLLGLHAGIAFQDIGNNHFRRPCDVKVP